MPQPQWSIQPLDPSEAATARALMALCHEAYTQEAQLLGVPASDHPPLQRSQWALQTGGEGWLGCFDGPNLVGALSVFADPDDESAQRLGDLAVAPLRQREGAASLLLHALLLAQGSAPFTVQLPARNAPALALLAQHGFREHQRWAAPAGAQTLRWLKLARKPGAPMSPAGTAWL
jgi:GNAT superfamily N-acetyltransferase